MSPRVLSCAAVLLGALAVLVWAFQGEPAPATARAGIAQEPPVQPLHAQASPPERQEDPDTEMQPGAATATRKAAQPWRAHFLVIDEERRPVAGALVSVWTVLPTAPLVPLDRAGGPAQLSAETDRDGRAQVRVACRSLVVMAAKVEYGSSNCVDVIHSDDDVDCMLVLEQPVLLRGHCVQGDGRPAAGAKVHATGSSPVREGTSPVIDPVTADEHGTFAVEVRKHTNYVLQAKLGHVESVQASVEVVDAPPPETTLVFAGALMLAGTVVDATGAPVADAAVAAWSEFHMAPDGPFTSVDHATATTDLGGRFTIAVKQFARYQLVANAKGHASSAATWTETTATRPRAEVRLQLQAFATITGRVLHDDGTPFSGIQVVARPEAEILPGPGVFGPGEQDLFGSRHVERTAGDGSFLLTVHPGTTWAIRAMPRANTWGLWSEQPGVAAGSRDVTMYVSAAAAAGCVVHGRVTGPDGAPVRNYRVELVSYRGGQPIDQSVVEVSVDGEPFTLPALSLGEQYGIHVGQKDGEGPLAPAIVDPFTATHTQLDLVFRLEPWGEIPVLVVDASGRVCQGLRVWCRRNLFHAEREPDARTDGEGRALLPHCIPGLGTLLVFNGAEKLSEQDLTIAPGRNAEVVVQLPPAGRR